MPTLPSTKLRQNQRRAFPSRCLLLLVLRISCDFRSCAAIDHLLERPSTLSQRLLQVGLVGEVLSLQQAYDDEGVASGCPFYHVVLDLGIELVSKHQRRINQVNGATFRVIVAAGN